MKKLLLLFVCVSMLCACGSNDQSSKEQSNPQPQEEFKNIPASSVKLIGRHANLFKVDGDCCRLSLVKVDGDWQVRLKMTITNKKPYSQLSDKAKYEQKFSHISGSLLNASEVELSSLDIPSEDWNMLVSGDIDDKLDITVKTWSFEHYSYAKAKEIFDNVVSAELRGFELDKAKDVSNNAANKSKSNSSGLFDDDLFDEGFEELEDVQELLELEMDMLNELQKMSKYF